LMASEQAVLITGATGFIGSHVVNAFVGTGAYRVRAAVRNANSEKAAFLRNSATFTAAVELVEVDLLDGIVQWRDAMRGCKIVVHTALPNTTSAADAAAHGMERVPAGEEEDFFRKRAVEATERIVRAAIVEGVERIVLTSSFAAIGFGHTPDPLLQPPGPSDGTWTNLDGLRKPWDAYPVDVHYARAKTLAERRAFELLVDEEHVSLASVCPVQTYGPLLSKHGGDASMVVLRGLLAGNGPAVPNFPCACVDVRDVARLHLYAATSADAKGKRFLAVSHCDAPAPMLPEVAGVLAAHFGPRGFRVPTRRLPTCLVRCLAHLVDPSLKLLLRCIDQRHYFAPVNGTTCLGSWIPWETSLVDMAESMIKHGKLDVPAVAASQHASGYAKTGRRQ